MTYIPTGAAGEMYLVLLNTYIPGGTPRFWSGQIRLSADSNIVRDDLAATQVALVRDAWVEVRVDVNFDTDTYSSYYNGVAIGSGQWSKGGAVALDAVDLFTTGITEGYMDDVLVLN